MFARLLDWARRRRADDESQPYQTDGWNPHRQGMALRWLGADPSVVLMVLGLLSLGALMVYSASIPLSEKFGTTRMFFLQKHLISIAMGLMAAAVTYSIPLRVWRHMAVPIGIFAAILLVVVLVPGIGRVVNGSRRWIGLGFMNLQVSEVAKFAAVLFAAHYTVMRQEYMHSVQKGFGPMLLIMVAVCAVVGLQPDLGATAVIVIILLGVLFLGGLNLWIFGIGFSTAIIAFCLMITMTPYRMRRLMAYLDPFNPEYAEGKGYQLVQSLLAFGRGEFNGLGLGNSVEKMSYLPEAHTDFILAVIAEELGFVGVAALMFVYYWLVRRAFGIGRQAIRLGRVFAGLVAQGIGIWIGVQVAINAGVATGLLPTKGLTLPFVSFGGSALLVTIAAIGLLLRVDAENRVLMRGGMV